MGWAILQAHPGKNGTVYKKLKNAGPWETKAGAEAFAELYRKSYPGADIVVQQDIRGNKAAA